MDHPWTLVEVYGLQASVEVCGSLKKEPSAPFFIPASTAAIQHLSMLSRLTRSLQVGALLHTRGDLLPEISTVMM